MSQSDRQSCQDKTQSNLITDAETVDVIRTQKWQIFHHLQSLEVTCHCATNNPLQVRLDNVRVAIQLWSVVRQHRAPRRELVDWLDRCWQIENYRDNCR